ncbi:MULTISPECIES: hypothetical protein [unclassified Bacillus (in: firmicutes)]|uniref:hypothetical protein n=1 Tax=unclassified Bacillus (in: firmicutes) TaxID=185979 RepID=UPI0031013AF0
MLFWKNNYRLFEEAGTLVIYNFKTNKAEKALDIKNNRKEQFQKLNEIDLNSTDQQKLFNLINPAFNKYLKEFGKEELEQLAKIQKFSIQFALNLKDSYVLKSNLIQINIEMFHLFYRIFNISVYEDLSFDNFRVSRYSTNQLKSIFNNAVCNDKKVYLVNYNSVSRDDIEYIEDTCNKKNLIRLYYGETKKEIVIGPGLIGNEQKVSVLKIYEGHYFENTPLSLEANALISSLLTYELPKYHENLMNLCVEDISLCKGKIFMINKKNFSAEDIIL